MQTILILMDQQDEPMSYDVEHYALRWKKAGHRVLYHVGHKNIPDADIVLLHINLSVVPKAYLRALRDHPLVLNRGIPDISRRRFSRLLLRPTDAWEGPVIVKTNANYGGFPERRHSNHSSSHPSSPASPLMRLLANLHPSRLMKKTVGPRGDNSNAPNWRTAQTIHPLEYPVYANINAVPADVWNNPNLIVERFVRESADDLYHTRYCIFFGDKTIAGRLSAPVPIVKFGNAVNDVEITVPDEIRAWRRKLNIDYGRFDYVEENGERYLIDVNKTEKGGPINYQYPKEMDFLASGLAFYLNGQ